MINDELSYPGRFLRTQAGKLLMGSAGNRLFADYLDIEPGFCGRIDFIHKTNIQSLFRVKCSVQNSFDTAQTVWHPGMLTMIFENSRIKFSEIKFITFNDCAVSCQSWTNKTDIPFEISLEVKSEMCDEGKDLKTGCILLKSPETGHGYAIGVSVKSNAGLENDSIILMANQSVDFTIVAATGNLSTESFESIIKKSIDFFQKDTDYVDRHNREYQAFYNNTPRFNSSDDIINKTWHYRWFILKHNLAFPDFGNLRGAVMYEGRSHKIGKQPFSIKGWEFSKLINLSTPLHLSEMRWHHDKKLLYQMIGNMIKNLDENGIFCSAYVDRRKHSYANFSVWAIWQLWLTDGNDEFFRGILPELKRYIENESKVYSRDDNLQIETQHNRTGKEYQPSYWYFHDFPLNPKDSSLFTPLKRVDRSVYHYRNVSGIANLCKALGDSDYVVYEKNADDIKKDILNKMWDEETGFFYDLHFETDEKAMVKNIVGIYPYWAGITNDSHLRGLELLFDKNHFNTACPFPSVSKECKAYRAEGGWMGSFIKGRDGCVWCGPSWPYTTGIAVDAIAHVSKKNKHCYDKQFIYFLKEYSLQHFKDKDIRKPYLVEHYNSETGEPLSDEADYNHSLYIDLIISHIAGVQITHEGINFDPIETELDYFILENLKIRNDCYTISYKKENCDAAKTANYPNGYAVYKNGLKLI